MHRPTLLFLFSATLVAQQPLFRVVDLDVGARERVEFSDGKSATVKLLSTSETRDRVRSAIRDARVEVEINGARATLSCGNYRLPVAVGGVQADCAVTKAYYQDSNADHWALVKDARLRLWPAGSPYMPPGSFVYPVRQRWFATRTQMGNEPTYVDDGESIGSRRIYYHAGLDIGGAEGLVDVVAATDGLVVGVGTEILDKEKHMKIRTDRQCTWFRSLRSNLVGLDAFFGDDPRRKDLPGSALAGEDPPGFNLGFNDLPFHVHISQCLDVGGTNVLGL